MGYQQKNKVYKLKFEDPDMDGLEVRMTSMTTGEVLGISKWNGLKEQGLEKTDEGIEAMETMLQIFSKHLISWNLEEEEEDKLLAVPSTYEGVLSQDFDFITKIIDAWMEYVGNIPSPLDKQSKNGKSVLEVSLPMETLSPSLTD